MTEIDEAMIIEGRNGELVIALVTAEEKETIAEAEEVAEEEQVTTAISACTEISLSSIHATNINDTKCSWLKVVN
jgi:hypothetical protein